MAKTGRSKVADLRQLLPDNPLVQEFKELTRDHHNLVEMQTRLVNQLTATLKAYYPGGVRLVRPAAPTYHNEEHPRDLDS